MSELREKDLRWQIAFEITTGDLDGKSSGEIADNILALLPSPAINDELDRLRGKIERQDEELQHYKHHLERAHSHHAKLAAQLLSASSPAMSGVEAVSTCIQCCGLGGEIPQKAMNILCPDCHGTDKIVRELTEHEASEVLKLQFEGLVHATSTHYAIFEGEPTMIVDRLILPTGETLRLKKEK